MEEDMESNLDATKLNGTLTTMSCFSHTAVAITFTMAKRAQPTSQ